MKYKYTYNNKNYSVIIPNHDNDNVDEALKEIEQAMKDDIDIICIDQILLRDYAKIFKGNKVFKNLLIKYKQYKYNSRRHNHPYTYNLTIYSSFYKSNLHGIINDILNKSEIDSWN